jgi:hypothetical protein
MKVIISRPIFEAYKKHLPELKEEDFYISERLPVTLNSKK